MAYVGVLLIALVNSVVLFFASFLAAGGDGSADGIYRVWIFGYTWIGLCTIAALVACARKGLASGLLLVASALPSAFVAGIIAIVVGSAIGIKVG